MNCSSKCNWKLFIIFVIFFLIGASGLCVYADSLKSSTSDESAYYTALAGLFVCMGLFLFSVKYFISNDKDDVDYISQSTRHEPEVSFSETDNFADKEKEYKDQMSVKMKSMAEQFETSVIEVLEKLQNSSSKLHGMITDMKDEAANSTMMCDAVASSSDSASAAIENSAAAVEEMGASINEVASQVSQAEQITCDAVTKVDQAGRTVAELDNSAKEIGSIVNLINDIADRTNLLALNATIEAARAGDAGKGFTVVANEVKALSSQTADATDQISAQVKDMQINVTHAVDAIKSIGDVMTKMDEVSAAVAAAVEEQSSAVGEIASSASSAAVDSREISEDIRAVSANSKSAQDVAVGLVALVDTLRKDTADMEDRLDGFLDKIRNVG